MIEIDECKAVKASGYTVSQKGESLTVTLASIFQNKVPCINGLPWKGGDRIEEMYAEDVMIDGEPCDVVLVYRSRRKAE